MAKTILEGKKKIEQHLINLFKARFPFVYIPTWEEVRIINIINDIVIEIILTGIFLFFIILFRAFSILVIGIFNINAITRPNKKGVNTFIILIIILKIVLKLVIIKYDETAVIISIIHCFISSFFNI